MVGSAHPTLGLAVLEENVLFLERHILAADGDADRLDLAAAQTDADRRKVHTADGDVAGQGIQQALGEPVIPLDHELDCYADRFCAEQDGHGEQNLPSKTASPVVRPR